MNKSLKRNRIRHRNSKKSLRGGSKQYLLKGGAGAPTSVDSPAPTPEPAPTAVDSPAPAANTAAANAPAEKKESLNPNNEKSKEASKARAAALEKAERHNIFYYKVIKNDANLTNVEGGNKITDILKTKDDTILIVINGEITEYVAKNGEGEGYTYAILDTPIRISDINSIDRKITSVTLDESLTNLLYKDGEQTEEKKIPIKIKISLPKLGTYTPPVTQEGESSPGLPAKIQGGELDFTKTTFSGSGPYLIYKNNTDGKQILSIRYNSRDYNCVTDNIIVHEEEIAFGYTDNTNPADGGAQPEEKEPDYKIYYKDPKGTGEGQNAEIKSISPSPSPSSISGTTAFAGEKTDLQSYMFTFYVPVHSGIKTGMYINGNTKDLSAKFNLMFNTASQDYGVGKGKDNNSDSVQVSKLVDGLTTTSIGTTKQLINQLNQNDKGIWGFTKIVCNEVGGAGGKSEGSGATGIGNRLPITTEEAILVTQEINKGTRYEKMFFQASSLLIEICNSIVHRKDNVTGNYYNIPFFDKVRNANNKNTAQKQDANNTESNEAKFSSFSFINKHINSVNLGDYMAKKNTQTISSFRRVEYVTNLNQKDTGASKYEFDDEHKIYIVPGIN